VPAPEIDQWESESFAPLSIVALPPARFSVPALFVVPLGLAVPVSESESPFEMAVVEPAP
jgi:hypothetical protein